MAVRGVRRVADAWQAERRAVLDWAGLVALGIALTAAAAHLGAALGTPAPPFTGRYRIAADPASVLAPLVAVAVLGAVRAGLLERLSWPAVLTAGYAAAFAWAIALALVDGTDGIAAPVRNNQEYLADAVAIGRDPTAFIRGFVDNVNHSAQSYSVATRTHPPGPVLFLWAMTRLGVSGPLALGLLVTAVGVLSVPLIAIAVRSLCHEDAARRLLPVLVLAPYAVWLAVSMDAVTLTLVAAFVAVGVVGSEPGRRPWWAVGSGLLIGVAAIFGYAAAWLGGSVIAAYFVRRRPLLIVLTGAAALVPLWLFQWWGFSWPEGLGAARADFATRVSPHRSWWLWALLDLLLLLIACGPAIALAARRLKLTPGWPFLVGAGLAVVFAIASGLSRGEVERSWIPFYPWLLVPAVAPPKRPDGDGDGQAGPVPVLLVALGAASAVVVEAVLRTTW